MKVCGNWDFRDWKRSIQPTIKTMISFNRWAARPKVSRFRFWPGSAKSALSYLLWALLLLLPGAGCITVDSDGNPLDERKKENYWNLQKLPEGPFWSDEEKSIPFLVVGLPSDVPERFVLQDIPAPADQGRLAAGTAYAAGYLFMTRRERARGAQDYTCSPEFVYNSLNGGKNVGLEVLEVMEFLKGVGCADRSHFSAAEPFMRPGPEAIAEASKHIISGYARVDLARPTHIMANLLQGRPIIVTLQVSQNFLNLDEFEWKKPEGLPMGRHTVALIGYDRTEETWIFQNSAGEEWGHNGRFSLHRQWFSRLATQGYVAW